MDPHVHIHITMRFPDNLAAFVELSSVILQSWGKNQDMKNRIANQVPQVLPECKHQHFLASALRKQDSYTFLLRYELKVLTDSMINDNRGILISQYFSGTFWFSVDSMVESNHSEWVLSLLW